MALVITVDKLSEEPLYEQIRRQVVAAIAAGDIRPGDALPSVRSLAQDLGINLHTVNRSYATLRDEGFVILLGRRESRGIRFFQARDFLLTHPYRGAREASVASASGRS